MAGLIPENILEDILSRVDIVEIISGYIPLKRAGRNFKANCPFHHEKSPSFMVSPDRQIYHCFGCGESGNAFKFLMRYERLEFPEAVEALAKRTGVILPEFHKNDTQAVNLASQIYKVNELAALYYESNLHSQPGLNARNYFGKRGIKEETAKAFKLGLALDKWDGLIEYLKSKGISIDLMEKSGLILPKDKGGYYDRFRNRLIFPIFDVKSQVIGAGARVLDDSLPKYINSPETPVYIKGKHLYGLNFAKDAIRDNDCVAVVEGYLDFIIPYQEGFQNIVASLGTALTVEQVRLLKRYTHNIVMVYDGDAAGQMAALRSLDIFIEEDVLVKVASLPEGFDPDSFVRKYGVAAFKDLIKNADNLFDYKLKILKLRFSSKEAEGKAKISAEMLATIKKFTNAVLRTEYIKKLSNDLNVNESALKEDLGKVKEDKVNLLQKSVVVKKEININATEKLLIKLMLEEAELLQDIRQHLDPADFQDEITSKIVATMFSLAEQGRAIDKGVLMSHFGDADILQVVCESAFMPEIAEGKDKIARECIERLKKDKIKSTRERLHNEIKAAQSVGDNEKLNRLMQEFHLLIKKG